MSELKPAPSQHSAAATSVVKRFAVACAAVVALYIGGFLWDQVSPLAYSVVFFTLASTPLLLKISFWKKIVLLFPLLILRVVGKFLVKGF